MKEMLDREKKLRKKGFADKQVEEMVGHLRAKGIDTVWGVQNTYDSAFLKARVDGWSGGYFTTGSALWVMCR